MSQNYKPGDVVWTEFITSVFSTGAAANADSLPTGTVQRNGTDDGAVTVTVTNVDTGRYKATFTIPATYVPGDVLALSVAATVSSVAGKGVVWQSRVGPGLIRAATAGGGAAGSITLDGSASATTDFYKGSWIVLVSQTGAGQVRLCTAYNGSTKVATVVPNWATAPDSTSVFTILSAAGVDVEMWNATAVPAPATAGIPDINVKNIVNVAATLDANNVLNVSTKYWGGTLIVATSIPVGTAAGAAGGLFISGTNAGTTTFGALTVTGATTLTGAVTATNGSNNVTGVAATAASIQAGVGMASANLDTQLAALDADVLSRLATSGYTVPPTEATIAGAVWDVTLASHLTAGSTGFALNAAGSAGDPWGTLIPGAYGAGTAGHRLGNIPDIAAGSANGLPVVGSAMTLTAAYDAAKTAAQAGSAMTLTAAYDAAKTAAPAGAQMDLVSAPNATALTAFVAAINAAFVEGTITKLQYDRIMLSVSAGITSGAGTSTFHARDRANTKDRVTASTDGSGNRTAVTVDGT